MRDDRHAFADQASQTLELTLEEVGAVLAAAE